VNQRELDRNAARQLAIIRHAREVTGNVAMNCRYYGISRQIFYTWYRRYETEGLAGLRDRSKRPAHCLHETPAEVVAKIIYLRISYHLGPAKISMYLKRYHDVQVSNSGVWRILKRLDLNRLPASQRYKRHDRKWKRYEKPMPGHAVQVDVKFIAPLPSPGRKKYYQFTAIDDCTRRGMRAPVLAVGDGALGFWGALREVFPEAAAKITGDPNDLLAFCDYPGEHWVHLRTTNPIESTFATVRHRTKITKGPGSRAAGLAMAFKLIESAQDCWRAVNAPHLVALVRAGARFEHGKIIEREAPDNRVEAA
jgi:transposase